MKSENSFQLFILAIQTGKIEKRDFNNLSAFFFIISKNKFTIKFFNLTQDRFIY